MPFVRSATAKQPKAVLESIVAFPPNRETLGGTAYFIVEKDANLLIDCPAWNEENLGFLQNAGGVRWLFLTHRGAMGRVKEFQEALGCEVVVQEQEAYLLPQLEVTTFQDEIVLNDHFRAFWTAGHSPGSACLYDAACGGVLFSGRHLLPNAQGEPAPLRTSKTFHWPRQLRNVERILQEFSPETLSFICPGASTGFLRGKGAIAQAYEQLAKLDLSAYRQQKPVL